MKGKYHIEIVSNKLRYELDIRRNITIIRGDSASGKTRLVSLISDYNNYGDDSGVHIECDVECVTVSGLKWKEQIEKINNSIIFIDEGNAFVRQKEFAELVDGNSNYFVLISREKLSTLPYSVNEIYGLRRSNKYNNIKQVFNEAYNIYSDMSIMGDIKPDILITEDSKSGYQFFNVVANKVNIECKSANGKDNVFNKIIELHRQSKDKVILAIVDGAAFGPEMEDIIDYIRLQNNIVIYTPESFEWLLLKSGILDVADDKLVNTYDYADSEIYFSWEQYYTSLIIEVTHKTQYQYSKSMLKKAFLSDRNISMVLKTINKIKFDI
ncbi:MAG: translation initiation factor 2 [Lachnospiraceae bacterium]|nr:translation initiation factor 2 [Lachnospiraceae bacterium]